MVNLIGDTLLSGVPTDLTPTPYKKKDEGREKPKEEFKETESGDDSLSDEDCVASKFGMLSTQSPTKLGSALTN